MTFESETESHDWRTSRFDRKIGSFRESSDRARRSTGASPPLSAEQTKLRIKLIVAITVASLCAGCAVETHDELSAEAYRLGPPGTSVRQAQDAFTSAGFQCVKSYISGKGDVMCDRMQGAFIAGCVQHVLLTFDAQKSSVESLDVTGPYCVGP